MGRYDNGGLLGSALRWFSQSDSIRVWTALFANKARKAGKYKPHQGDREMARRRGEVGWRSRHAA
jgi:hypothetical protein